MMKRFLPSEFGNVLEKENGLEPAKSLYQLKAKVRRTIEAESIPYTYISSNYFAGYFIPSLGQAGLTAPPRDKLVILGHGNAKGFKEHKFLSVIYNIHECECDS